MLQKGQQEKSAVCLSDTYSAQHTQTKISFWNPTIKSTKRS